MRRWVQRNVWAALRVAVGIGFTLATIVATFVPLTGPDWWRYVPVGGAVVATTLLIISEVRHGVGRPDIRIGEPQLLTDTQVSLRHVSGDRILNYALPLDRTYRVRIENRGVPTEVRVQLQLEPLPLGPAVRPLHLEGDRPEDLRSYRELVPLATDQAEWFDVVSMLRKRRAEGSDYILHNARFPSAVEFIKLQGQYEAVIQAFAGGMKPEQRQCWLVVDETEGTLELVPH